MDEYATKGEFNTAKEICDLKMSEFDRRENEIDRQLQELSKIVTQMAVTMKHNLEQTTDQETRIRALEGRRGEWFDKIMYLVLGGFVSYVATKVFGG